MNQIQTHTINQLQANIYRQKYNVTGGVVIFYNNEIQGWKLELGEPKRWRPGCFAYDTNSSIWRSSGGAYYSGATEWIKLNSETNNE